MKYCKIHRQEYMDFLHECPVCGGERWGKEHPPIRIDKPKEIKAKSVPEPIKKSKFKRKERKLTGFQL